jgi:hypothetical protein
MGKDDPFDLEKLQLNQGEMKAYSSKSAVPKARKRRQQFTLVPDVWKKRLAEGTTNCGTYKLALAPAPSGLEERWAPLSTGK